MLGSRASRADRTPLLPAPRPTTATPRRLLRADCLPRDRHGASIPTSKKSPNNTRAPAGNFEIFPRLAPSSYMHDKAEAFFMPPANCRPCSIRKKSRPRCARRFRGSNCRSPRFPGQGTALVGVLDPFWDSKGYNSRRRFHRFCGNPYPWPSDQTHLDHRRHLWRRRRNAHIGPAPLQTPNPTWSLSSTDLPAVARAVFQPRRSPWETASRWQD